MNLIRHMCSEITYLKLMHPRCLRSTLVVISWHINEAIESSFFYLPNFHISNSTLVKSSILMMTLSNGSIFRVTGPLCGGIHRSPVNSRHKGQWRGALIFSLIWAPINGWVNNGVTGNFRRHRAHYDVTVIICSNVSWVRPLCLRRVSRNIYMYIGCDFVACEWRDWYTNVLFFIWKCLLCIQSLICILIQSPQYAVSRYIIYNDIRL